MNLVMTMIVRDEDDVLEANLVHHLSQGADLVIVTDHRSTDGTPEILDAYARAGQVRVIRETGEDYLQAPWQNRMALMAHAEHGAEWVIGVDADEFWWPAAGTIADALAAIPTRYGIVQAPRPEFPPRPEDGRFFAERMVVRETVSSATLKVAHRGRPGVVVGHANHWVRGEGLVAAPLWPLRILHFPLRSLAQFEKRIAHRINEPARRSGSLPSGSELRIAYEQGRLAEAYAERVLSEEGAEAGVREGRLKEDTRLERFLGARRDPATGALAVERGSAPDLDAGEEERAELEWDALRSVTLHEEKWRERAEKHRSGRERAESRLEEARRRNAKLEARVAALEGSASAPLRRRLAGLLRPGAR